MEFARLPTRDERHVYLDKTEFQNSSFKNRLKQVNVLDKNLTIRIMGTILNITFKKFQLYSAPSLIGGGPLSVRRKPTHFCTCSNPEPGFPTLHVVVNFYVQ